jgi:hypothetical protein
MKKILSLITIAAFTALVACGPSAEEKAAAEKARQDSINQAMAAQMAADSAARAMEEMARMDSLSNIARQDSIARADSMAAAANKPRAKAKPKTTTTPTVAPGTPQVGKKKPGAK